MKNIIVVIISIAMVITLFFFQDTIIRQNFNKNYSEEIYVYPSGHVDNVLYQTF